MQRPDQKALGISPKRATIYFVLATGLFAGCAGKLPFLGDNFASKKIASASLDSGNLDPVPAEPDAKTPVTAAATLVHQLANQTLQATVEIRIASGYYLHDFDANNPANVPVTVSIEDLQHLLGQNVQWQYSDFSIEHGVRIFREKIRINGVASVPEGAQLPKHAKLVVRYQACSANACLEPAKIELVAAEAQSRPALPSKHCFTCSEPTKNLAAVLARFGDSCRLFSIIDRYKVECPQGCDPQRIRRSSSAG